MIKLDNIEIRFGDRKLFEGLSFEIEENSKIALAGPSGSGKTTIMNLIMGFCRPSKGKALYRGKALSRDNIREFRNECCWLPQDVATIGSGAVEEVIRYPFTFKANKKNEPGRDEIISTLERLRLPAAILGSKFEDISGGEKQRIGIAICELMKRKIYLLDEPASALDKDSKKAVADLILGNSGITVISATHDDYFLGRVEKIIGLRPMPNANIDAINLLIGSSILLLPLIILLYYRTGLAGSALFAFLRMAGQLSLAGIYLKYIFNWDDWRLNLLWVVVIILAASFIISNRSELKKKYFLIPLVLGLALQVVINSSVIAYVILGPENFFSARYLIPIAGMLVGNGLTSAIIGIRAFYNSLSKNEGRYRYYLMCGAGKGEALFSFTSGAMKEAFSPVIANTASIGLIWLPGMMAGQILGGSSPLQAIKYQIMIIIAIFVGSVVTVFISLLISKKFAFDDYDMFRKRIFLQKKKNVYN